MSDPEIDPIVRVLPDAARRLDELIADLGSILDIREKHLNRVVNEALAELSGARVTSSVLRLTDWPRLGNSATDTVVWDEHGRPRYVAELKWCHSGEDKVYEAIWDLFKMALTTPLDGCHGAYLMTGAPVAMWQRAFCSDLFDDATLSPEELCERRFATGRMRTAWDWLLHGGLDRYPERVPGSIRTNVIGRQLVGPPDAPWELRAVSVVSVGERFVDFTGGWPHGMRPEDARHPVAIGSA